MMELYIGAKKLYAIYPNGTKKWEYDIPHKIVSAPAIDENGIIYVGTIEAITNYLYAIFTNNGTLKWKYNTGGDDIWSSPTIDTNGIIYFTSNMDIIALYPDGTKRWNFHTNHLARSSPAIGSDGTVYCGSHDGNLYALFPNNGTLKWKYKTGDWVPKGPSIADDGTIYFGSWNGYLYAVYPNGTLKWKTGGYLAGTTPVIGADATIYVGNRYLSAIYPNNGSIKWTSNLGSDRQILGSSPCISNDGTIYFGATIRIGSTSYGGEIIAINSNGIEKWRESIADQWVHSSPAIGGDGAVYIGSTWKPSDGFLHAFGKLDSNAPFAPDIDGPTRGLPGIEYDYNFKAISPIGNDVYYWIEWRDGDINGWLGPYKSGEKITLTHKWPTFTFNKFIIRARAKDTDNLWGPWGQLTVTMPRNKALQNTLFWRLLERFPFLKKPVKL